MSTPNNNGKQQRNLPHGPIPFPTPKTIEEKLATKGYMDMCYNLIHVAYALQAEAEKLPLDMKIREEAVAGRAEYKRLSEILPGTYRAALMGQLKEKQNSSSVVTPDQVIKAFTTSGGDPNKAYNNMAALQDRILEPAFEYQRRNAREHDIREENVESADN